ncbi:hypothetical protein P6U16_10725 [Rhizobium sp. 32-5/1]|uniref:hypothetical protein n=1 Tax=Rhizobium sp. 32-5/1 TaxID=3019602 RepID=UPI00240DC1D6|nr:hypothetical protein [Rhizobium sp. 32-5/1]WEZ84944.1 hypothetical protein P6U16_10725 [Rhizobium sp. 32-5/1]
MNEGQRGRNGGKRSRLAGFLQGVVPRRFSIYLAALLLIAIVPSFIFSIVILKRSADAQEQVVASLLRASTGSVTRIVEREIEGMLTTLRVLSMTEQSDIENLQTLYQRAAAALRVWIQTCW